MPGLQLRESRICPSCGSNNLRYMAEFKAGGYDCRNCNYELRQVKAVKQENLNALTWKNELRHLVRGIKNES